MSNLAGIRKSWVRESMQMKNNHTIIINNNSCTAEASCTGIKIRDEERNLCSTGGSTAAQTWGWHKFLVGE